MQESKSTRYSVSYHLKDLLKRDPQTILDVAKWLETHAETNRDRAQRRGSRRMMARLIAAKQLIAATVETQAAKEVMDRTEGKVADRLIADHQKTVNIRIELAHSQGTLPSQVIDGEEVVRHALDQQSSEKELTGDQGETGDTLSGPITRGSKD